jgi:ATP-dependent protease HslVU (ClpYQ) peptidase subunit
MTCIVALEHEGQVYMGGDSASNSGWDSRITALRKVFIRDDFIIGCSGSPRMAQLLEYHLEVREQNEDEDDICYLITTFISAIRACLKDGGYTKIEHNQEEGGFFLVGYRGKIYTVESDFQVSRTEDDFTAIGCGGDYAIGALATMYELGILDNVKTGDPESAVLKALEIAGRFSNGVRGPYHVMST